MKSIRTVLIALIATTTLAVFSIQAFLTLSQYHDSMSEQIKLNLINQAEKEANSLYMPMRDKANDAANLATLVGSMPDYNESVAFNFMRRNVIKNDIFSGTSLALEPGVAKPGAAYYLPYIYKDANNQAILDWSYNGAHYFTKSWYRLGMSTAKQVDFSFPYQDMIGKTWISAVAPITRQGERIGVATADMIISNLSDYVAKLQVGKNGYAYVITAEGLYFGKNKNRENSAEIITSEMESEILTMEHTVVQADQSGLIQLGKANQLIAYAPIGETSLKLVLVYRQAEILGVLYQTLTKNAISFLAAIVVFIALLTFVIDRRVLIPLARLAEMATQVTRGNLSSFGIPYRHQDELGITYAKFQEMIDSLRTARAEIDANTSSLATKNAELERFTYTVSHDLRSPLITIKGFAGVIVKEIAQGKYDRVQSDLRRIENAADKMAELLNGLLTLSRIGRIANLSENIQMAELAKQVVELLHEAIQAKAIYIEVQEDMPEVFGDRNRIREVIQNLMENAIKFMDRPDGKIKIGCVVRDGETVYFVSDNGPGIDPQYHEKIFGLFDKLNNQAEGSGIGLALVKRIVEYHGGRIWVESKLGEGATFYYTVKTP